MGFRIRAAEVVEKRGLLMPAGPVFVGEHEVEPVEVVRIKHIRCAECFHVVHAGRRVGACARLIQRRQQHSGENRDDRDHDEELDEGERADHVFFHL